MTISPLYRVTVLVLNRQWVAVDAITPVDAFGHLAAGTARGVWVEGAMVQALEWGDWRGMSLKAGMEAVGTVTGPVRLPTVVVLSHYAGVPFVRPKFGFDGLWERDGGRCQYTGRSLRRAEADIDHLLPRSRGGVSTWENCVICDRRVNRAKGAKTPEEAGLVLLKMPKEPVAVAAAQRIRNFWRVEDWKWFLPGTS